MSKHTPKFKAGDLVQSTYKRSRWIGVIEYVKIRPDGGILYSIKPMFTADGRPIRKAYSRCLHEFYVRTPLDQY